MTVQCDTIRILAGRNGPIVTSVARLTASDHARVCELADCVVASGKAYAAIGTALGTGRIAVLRRMDDSTEVRGLIFAAGSGPSDTSELLEDHPLWASPAFKAGRTVSVAAHSGSPSLPMSWCRGLKRAPQGFQALDEAKPLPTARSESGVRERQYALRPSARVPIFAIGDAESGSLPSWPMAVCMAATACSVIFLLMSLALSRAHAAEATGSPIIVAPVQPKQEAPESTP